MRSRSRRRKSWRLCTGGRRASLRASGLPASQPSPIPPASRSNLRPRTWILLRLPRFKYLRPKTARDASRMAAELGPRAMFVAGGTDLFPKLKRRQFDVDALISLGFLDGDVRPTAEGALIGAGTTLAAASSDADLRAGYRGYAEAA